MSYCTDANKVLIANVNSVFEGLDPLLVFFRLNEVMNVYENMQTGQQDTK